MSEQVTTTPAATTTTAAPGTDKTPPADDQRVPYERFEAVNTKAKEAAERAKTLEGELASLRAQMDERETAGLPELERERKRAEQLEKRAQDAESRAEAAETAKVRSQRERIVLAAAKDLDDPSDALRYPEFVNVDDIEDADQAERAIKRLVKAKPKLLKDDGTDRPAIGRVLQDGRQTTSAAKSGGIDPAGEAQVLADGLKQFLKNR